MNRNSDEKIKLVEKGGFKIKDILGTKKQFKKSNCTEKWCPLCTKSEHVEPNTGEICILCTTNSVGNRWVCLACKEQNKLTVYEGETSRSARIRGAEHLKELEGNN